jgi:hypothetical protein
MLDSPGQSQANDSYTLENLLKNNVLSRMSRSFRGMLLTQNLSFVAMKKDWALFFMSSDQVIANCGDRIFLHSPSGPELASARVLETNYYRGRLVLGEFELQQRKWIARSHERVQPYKHNRAILIGRNVSIPVSLESLSLKGAGLLAYKPVDRGLEPRIGLPIKIEFRLPIGYGLFILSGVLVSILHPRTGFVYMGVKTTPNQPQSRLLEYYIRIRKREIIDELNWAFSKTSGPPGDENIEF